jgi:altronate dehydratase large subunit
VNAIAREVPGVKPITHTEGCGRGPADVAIASRTLVGLGANPNVAAVLVVGLGCEVIRPEFLLAGIAESGKRVEMLSIQEEGGSIRTARKGAAIARELAAEAGRQRRVECGWSNVVLGVECGGSDGFSCASANPVVGAVADWLVSQGGTVILSETTEMIGTEEILAKRTASPGIASRIRTLISEQRQRTVDVLGPLADAVISPGNMDGGISTIQEKSLGCIVKGGTTQVCEVLEYAETPTKKGLVIMDTPGSDIFSITALAAAGAQLIAFTTGRGTPAGSPIVPVIKVSSNTAMFERMRDDMDFNAGVIFDGTPIGATARSLIDLIGEVAAGRETRTEINANDLLAIHTTGPAF